MRTKTLETIDWTIGGVGGFFKDPFYFLKYYTTTFFLFSTASAFLVLLRFGDRLSLAVSLPSFLPSFLRTYRHLSLAPSSFGIGC